MKTGNEPLKAETHISRSGINRKREVQKLQFYIRMVETAREYAEALAAYDITAEPDNRFLGAIKSFGQSLLRTDNRQQRPDADH